MKPINNEYLMVHKSILPVYYEQVIAARDLINSEQLSVSDACKKLNISRSTYYKYKDFVYRPTENYGKKVVVAFNTFDERGILSSLLAVINEYHGNVMAIYQDTPIHNNAYITITIDIDQLKSDLNDLINELKQVSNVKTVELLAFE